MIRVSAGRLPTEALVPHRLVVTLSGVVGAGKSSAATAIVRELHSAGYQATQVRFQDFIRARAGGQHRAAPSPAAPQAETRWHGYRRRRLSPRVAAGHAFRTLLFRARLRRWAPDTVLVFDRYFYDSLVHFELESAGWPLHLLLRAIPAPTISAFLLIKETTILERRPRYSKEYAQQISAGYEALAERFPRAVVARTDDFQAVPDLASAIVARILERSKARERREAVR
jgi:thymidylate kinase